MQSVEAKNQESFTFKAHRWGDEAWPVTVICFSANNCLFTGSSDGTFTLWEKDSRKKISKYPKDVNGTNATNPRGSYLDGCVLDADFSKNNSGMFYLVIATG